MNVVRVALVTGASRGIGRAVCERLVEAGRMVLATARDQAALAELERAHPGKVRIFPCDLTADGAWGELLDALDAEGIAPDELVLSAGIVRYASVGEIADAALRAQLELNFVVPFLLTQRMGWRMKARGGGAIVHIASTLALRAAPQTAAYAASKAALLSATRSFALELAPSVRVNAIAPGVVDTDMIRVLRGPAPSDEVARKRALLAERAALEALHPLGRLGTPLDIAQATLFLLDAPWVTGCVLTVDGGLTIA